MGFVRLWPFFLAAVIPAIILLYLLKQKVKKQPVSAINLWKEAYELLQASSPWEKFRNQILMYLQIAAVLALIFALAEPFLRSANVLSDNLVLYLDTSGSMNGVYEEGKTKMEAAKEQALALVDEAGGTCRISVVTSSGTGHLELSSSTDKERVREVIRSLEATDCNGSLEEGKSLVKSMVSALTGYQVVAFTDSDFDMEKLSGSVVDFSVTGKNLAVEYVSHSRQADGTVLVIAQVKNAGTESMQTDLSLYLGDELYDVQNLSIDAGKSQTVYFKELTAGRYESGCRDNLYFRVETSVKDLLQEDNVAYDRFMDNGNKRVLLVTERNTFLEKALACNGNITVDKTDSVKVKRTEKNELYDLIVYDGLMPAAIEEGRNYLFVNPPEDIPNISKEKNALVHCAATQENVMVSPVAHTVTSYLEDFSFGCSRVQGFEKPDWADAIFKTEKQCVGFVGNLNGGKIGVLGFDLHDTEFPLQAEFPMFLYQLTDYQLDSGMISESSLQPGMTEEIRQFGQSKKVEIERIGNLDGSHESWTMSVESGYAGFSETEKAGIYRVSQGKQSEYFVVRYPVGQSAVEKKAVITGIASGGEQKAGESHSGMGRRLRTFSIVLLLVLLLVEAVVYLRRAGLGILRRQPSVVVLRILVFACVILALLDFSVSKPAKKTATIFLIDASESFAGSRDEAALQVKNAVAVLPKGEQAGVVAFGQDAQVEQFVADNPAFSKLGTNISATATNIEKAIQTAVALIPEEMAPRLVLLTDGKENEGSMENMASSLVSAGVSVDVWQMDSQIGEEVYLSEVSIPEKIKVGDHFQVKVEVQSTVDTHALLQLYAGEDLKQQKEIEVKKGSNSFMFYDTNKKKGFASYRAVIRPDVDTVSVNNEYMAFTEAENGKHVLLIEGKQNESEEFQKVLKAANISFDVVDPKLAPKSIVRMNEYKTIILENVSAYDLPEKFLELVKSYVKDYGGGLVAIGGKKAFAPGGYKDTDLEKVLPVDMDLSSKKKIPEMSMVMVIDHSGSMGDSSGDSKLSLAKEAAKTAVDNLRDQDHVGILSFDDTYTWNVKLQQVSDRSHVRKKISGIKDGGGTSIYPALKEAYKKIAQEDTPIKHILLLTDGEDSYTSGYAPLLQKITNDDITVSTVAVGRDADNSLLRRVAELGDGRFYQAKKASELPNIFTQEVYQGQKTYLINREFTPIIASASRLLETSVIEQMPLFLGYVGTTLKDRASAALISDEDDDPLLAYWQYGLGRTVAFTSDVTNEWTGACAGWENYSEFWKQIISWTLDETVSEDSAVVVQQTGSGAKITYTTQDRQGADSVTATYSDLEGESHEMELRAVTPGVYEGEIALHETGIYGIHVSRSEDGKIVDSKNTQLSLQYSKEFRFQDQADTLDGFVTKCQGQYIDTLDGVFDLPVNNVDAPWKLAMPLLVAAFILFLLDILNRKFMMPWRKLIPDISGIRENRESRRQQAAQRKEQKEAQAAVQDGSSEKKEELPEKKKKRRNKKRNNQEELLDVAALMKGKSNRR